jgi:hypothetical protein
MVYLIVVLSVMWLLITIVGTWEDNNKNKKARRRFLNELKRK